MKNLIFLTLAIFCSIQIYSQEPIKSTEEQRKLAEETLAKELLEYFKSNEDKHYANAVEYFNNKEYFLSLQEINKAIGFSPFYFKYKHYKLRADAKVFLDDYRGAIVDIDSLIERFPENKLELLFSRAYCNFILKNPTSSIFDLDYLINNQNLFKENNDQVEINEIIAKSYSLRGLIKINNGEKNSGCLDLSKSGELGLKEAYDMIKKHCN